MARWAQLQNGIRREMDKRRFELATFAAAHALKSTACSIAHGKVLAQFIPAEDVLAIGRGETPSSLTPAEASLIAFARKVAVDATTVTAVDVQGLKRHAFSDGEIFDIAATSAARSFWTKLLDALGVEADAAVQKLGHVWKWAGQFRTTEKNIGVHPSRIGPDLRQLIDDCRYQIEHGSYPPDELLARFHHRLVVIHPYPNGNGRHSRLAADLLVVALGQPRLTWGSAKLVDAGQTRQRYAAALRAADAHDIRPLLQFVRS